jgi:hypothetical protein
MPGMGIRAPRIAETADLSKGLFRYLGGGGVHQEPRQRRICDAHTLVVQKLESPSQR